MADIVVQHALGAYPVHVLRGPATRIAAAVDAAAPTGRLVVVSDDTVAALYAGPLAEALRSTAGRDVRVVTFAAGEASKSLDTARTLWSALFDAPFDRGDVIVALGGGVTGDLAGFVAATAMRGVRFVQVPTTVLAMSDAAIGGKTGVNVPQGKNLVGAFHAPEAVVAWIDTLQTLSERERRSGLAEIIKSAWIEGPDAVDQVARDAAAMAGGDLDALERGVDIAARLKARIVTEDEREGGRRRLLNLGHTFGHAIETSTGYGTWTHGEAVAAGMVLAARASEAFGFADASFERQMRTIVEACGLPVEPPDLAIDEWLDPMLRDKKRSGDGVRLVLGRRAGEIFDQHVEYVHLRSWLARNRVAAPD